MNFNPFEQKTKNLCDTLENWEELYPDPYDKNEVSPFTKLRIILMNGTKFESVWFGHQFSRHCSNNEIRRQIAISRRVDQYQQKTLANLKPINETILETTIGYEQLAVELTSILAKREPNKYVKMALDFALLEDFDHLYRYADLLEMEHHIDPNKLVGELTEIMPGRPTISEVRAPVDDIRKFTDYNTADLMTKLNIAIITAAEQQTMNYYMNAGQFYTSNLGRKLYSEIAMIEEEHVTHYGSLIDTRSTWLEENLMHEYVQAYLYYSCVEDETNKKVRKIWQRQLDQQLAKLNKAAEMLEKYEKKHWAEVIPNACFPELLKFSSNKEYVRKVLNDTVNITTYKEDYVDCQELKTDTPFNKWQKSVNKKDDMVASHNVICDYIENENIDYRVENKPHPIPELADRHTDNTEVGRYL